MITYDEAMFRLAVLKISHPALGLGKVRKAIEAEHARVAAELERLQDCLGRANASTSRERHRAISEEQVKAICLLRAEGKSYSQISRLVDIGISTAWNVINRKGKRWKLLDQS